MNPIDFNIFIVVLLKKTDGLFFVYASGGPESPYAVEKITCVSKAKADVWVAEH